MRRPEAVGTASPLAVGVEKSSTGGGGGDEGRDGGSGQRRAREGGGRLFYCVCGYTIGTRVRQACRVIAQARLPSRLPIATAHGVNPNSGKA